MLLRCGVAHGGEKMFSRARPFRGGLIEQNYIALRELRWILPRIVAKRNAPLPPQPDDATSPLELLRGMPESSTSLDGTRRIPIRPQIAIIDQD
jgi:hypothetical protein